MRRTTTASGPSSAAPGAPLHDGAHRRAGEPWPVGAELAGGRLADVDALELNTVGVDVGSSTAHLMFARVRLERLADALSSRFVVTHREVRWRSPVLLTPYTGGNRIDAAALGAFVARCEAAAGTTFAEVDSGAVLLTGTALARVNAKAVADALARDVGRFVCAAAGHHMEAELAAHGSGAVALSARTGTLVLNVDIGGGTAKFALAVAGRVVASAALGIGGRLLAWDPDRRLTRIEGAARALAGPDAAGLVPGAVLDRGTEARLAKEMAAACTAVIAGSPLSGAASRLWLTEAYDAPPPGLVMFSGGVSEFLDGREAGEFADLGPSVAAAHAARLDATAGLAERVAATNGIRATVIGASQFATQVSGSTVHCDARATLPVHGLPVVRPDLALDGPGERALDPQAIAAACARALGRRAEAIERAGGVAWAIAWSGPPTHARLRALAEGLVAALGGPAGRAAQLVVVALDCDLGASLGGVLRDELGFAPALVCVDGLELGEMDFVDLAPRREPSGVVPVVVKSLVFAG